MLLKSKKSFFKFKVNFLFQSFLVIIVVKLIKIMQKKYWFNVVFPFQSLIGLNVITFNDKNWFIPRIPIFQTRLGSRARVGDPVSKS